MYGDVLLLLFIIKSYAKYIIQHENKQSKDVHFPFSGRCMCVFAREFDSFTGWMRSATTVFCFESKGKGKGKSEHF